VNRNVLNHKANNHI